MPHYIWQRPVWPDLKWQSDPLLAPLGRARLRQGKLLSKALALGFDLGQRQRKVLNRLLDAGPGGFEGGLTTRRYAGLAGVSKPTAQREIADLVARGMLRPNPGGGRSTSYDVAWEED